MHVVRYHRYRRVLQQLLSSWVFLCCAASTQACDLAEPLEFTQVGQGVYVHEGLQEDIDAKNCGDIANIGFVVGEKSVAIIDPGGSPAVGRHLFNAVSGITPLPISHVIVTHFHPDHLLGGAQMGNDIKIVTHRNYSRALAQRGQFYLERYAELFSDGDEMKLVQSTVPIEHEGTVNLGGRILRLTAHQTAHTDNDLSVLDVETRILWAGDLLFHQRIPSLDGSVNGWLDVMDELSALAPELVVPGHGPVGQWNNIASKQRRYLEILRKGVREVIAVNGRLADAVDSVGAEEQTNWLLFNSLHKGNVTRVFTELEWE